MKRILFLVLTVAMSTAISSAAMSNSRIRQETRFLTDKMAYELNLSTAQYNDVYEINYDFIAGISPLMGNVLRGDVWAMNRYYDFLDIRNDDLRWVLNARQYSRFMQALYFYRPVYVSGGRWAFRVYITYTNPNHFFFPRPRNYRTYRGGNMRNSFQDMSFYRGRHNHPAYDDGGPIRGNDSFYTSRRSDFGSVNIRPETDTRPVNSTPSQGNSNNSVNRPDQRESTTRRNVSNDSREQREQDRSSSSRIKTENTKVKESGGSSESRSRSRASDTRNSDSKARQSNARSSGSSSRR